MSKSIFPRRFTRIDDLTRPDRAHLTEEDKCFFIGGYTAREWFGYSAVNHLISNFKKPIDRYGRPEWHYKERAIETAAEAFRVALRSEDCDGVTFVPLPPSLKGKGRYALRQPHHSHAPGNPPGPTTRYP